MKPASNSQSVEVSAYGRLKYLLGLTKLHIERLRKGNSFEHIADQLELFRTTYSNLTGKSLENGTTLEIGYGQRPFRLMGMQSLGVRAFGIDLDQPLNQLNATTIIGNFRKNGAVRGLKSVARRVVFDGAEYRDLNRMLKRRFGVALKPDYGKMLVGDAANSDFWGAIGGNVDFIHSDDVFEHIPAEALEGILATMAGQLADDGVAVITPNVFTGIGGGHDLGWYMGQVNQDISGRGPPWGHLTGETPPADTYLNKMLRSEYRELFARHFQIVSEEAVLGRLGSQYLTEERRKALSNFSEDELFSNRVRFVLVKKR